MQQDHTREGKDPYLWQVARKRASFKYHLFAYLLVNSFLWILWFVTSESRYNNNSFAWPVFPMFGWGIGLFFHFIGAYTFRKNNLAEREYLKLTREKNY
jgi:hypothetical protein